VPRVLRAAGFALVGPPAHRFDIACDPSVRVPRRTRLARARAGSRRPECCVSTSGWIFMTISITGVLTLLIACYWRLLRQAR
jgi:hypothetical protein